MVGVFINNTFQTLDNRGYNLEILDSNNNYKLDTVSVSTKNVLRGLHGDFYTNKLIQCLFGDIFFVIADLRKESTTYLQHEYYYLKNNQQVLLPPGVFNAHLCLSKNCVFYYKMNNHFKDYSKNQLKINWKDPQLNIKWPIDNPILSIDDLNAKTIKELNL